MLFDGFTVFAQLVNFLLLVWLLKRYLYRPILNAVDAREKLIAAQLSEAETQKAAALEERRQFETQNYRFTEQRESLLRLATEEVERERLKLLADARREADELRAGFALKLASDRLAWEREFAERAQDEVFATARQALRDLADVSLEAQVVHVLVKKLQTLAPEEQLTLRGSTHRSGDPVIVTSGFALTSEARAEIQAILASLSLSEREVKFNTNPGLICGMEIVVDGHSLAWCVSDYFDQAEVAVRQTAGIPSSNGNQHVAVHSN